MDTQELVEILVSSYKCAEAGGDVEYEIAKRGTLYLLKVNDLWYPLTRNEVADSGEEGDRLEPSIWRWVGR